MIKGKKILAIIPARGGSKRLPRKNIIDLNGKPLIAWSIEAGLNSKYVDRVIVSTDDIEIAKISEKWGADIPFIRPKELATDIATTVDVIMHALINVEGGKEVYDYIMLLQPTSPLRTSEHVSNTIKMLVNGDWDAVWTVSETDSKSHPLKQLNVNNNRLDYYDDNGKNIVARQQLSTVYHKNGIAYAITRDCILHKKSIKGNKTGAYIIHGNHISIDTEWDLSLVEFILSKK